MPTVDMPADPAARVLQFIRDFFDAPDSAEIELRPGLLGGLPALVIQFQDTIHAFTLPEARRVADIAEQAMHQYPDNYAAQALENLILALRASADRVEREGVAKLRH